MESRLPESPSQIPPAVLQYQKRARFTVPVTLIAVVATVLCPTYVLYLVLHPYWGFDSRENLFYTILIIALVFGAWSAFRAQARRSGRPLAYTTFCVASAEGIIVLAWLFVISMSPGIGELRARVKCQSNMRQIWNGIFMFANANEGQFPKRLEDLLPVCDLSSEVLVCPDALTANYIYVGAGLRFETVFSGHPSTVVLYEPFDNHDGAGTNVLLADGRVLHVDRATMERVLQQLRVGHNPPHGVDFTTIREYFAWP